jgi:hypothetical protein
LVLFMHPWSTYLCVYLHACCHHHCFAIRRAQTLLVLFLHPQSICPCVCRHCHCFAIRKAQNFPSFFVHFCVVVVMFFNVDNSWINMSVFYPSLTSHCGTPKPHNSQKVSMHLSFFFATLNLHH